MQQETLSAIAAMLTGFGASSTDPDIQIRAYALAAHGNRADAVESACARFIRGEVDGHKASRCPTVAEFAKECRSEHSRITAMENRRPALPKPEEERVQHSWDHRVKMIALFDKLKLALKGDKDAQRELVKYKWKMEDRK